MTMEITMYDNLLLLPLFQGLSKNDLTAIIEKVKFNFLTLKKDEIFIHQGESCNQIAFLLNGELEAETQDKEGIYTLSEVYKEPHIIEPHSLFGMEPVYSATYKARSLVGILTIDKTFVFSELNNREIFRINFMNILSSRAQAANQKLWDTRIGTLNEKIIHFINLRSQKPDGEKTLKITMEDLGRLIDETRINVSRLLNELEKNDLVQLNRKAIHIPDFEKLVQHLLPN